MINLDNLIKEQGNNIARFTLIKDSEVNSKFGNELCVVGEWEYRPDAKNNQPYLIRIR